MPNEELPVSRKNNLVERREFLSGAATLAGASIVGGAAGSSLLDTPASAAPFPEPEPPSMTPTVERKLARWQDQRWLLDAVIAALGPEWDQGRLGGLANIPGGAADAAGLRARIHKFNDISREFARAAVRREREARQYEKEGRTIPAREGYFLAAHLYAGAQWPIFENTPDNIALNEKKNGCYAKYIQFADHEIRRVEVPFGGGKTLPGYLHLPPNRSGRVPCVWSISGLDSNKEGGAAIYGDGLRERGIATLALEGPGQNECALREIYLTQTNWAEAGRVVLDWLRSQKEIDPDRIALRGASLGSYLGTQVASIDARLKGAALQAMAVEPTMHTAFETGSPSFKLRFLYYTGLQTEAELDKFLQTWTLHGVAEKVKCPYLLVGGEDDQLSPVEYGFQLMDLISAPKQMILYEGALHSVSGSPATTNGPATGTFVAEWFKDRFDGKPMQTKLMKVDAGGQVHDFKFEDARKSLSVSLLWQGAEQRATSPEKPTQEQEP
ncbi:MAG: alpha/beta hydrolase [Acidobacteriia bacterium]|nr:alpha/beta hydrolase [Terriglobia bacterium]